ncbi:MAG TPA: hypothetical protein VF790_14140, partial [Dissulfurispiraceae bacterium]
EHQTRRFRAVDGSVGQHLATRGRIQEVDVGRAIHEEAVALGGQQLVVVGGKNSANTTQLANLCIAMSVPTYHIETSSEIEGEWFSCAERVGITAGASTPDWIITEVEKRIRDIGERGRNGNANKRGSKCTRKTVR